MHLRIYTDGGARGNPGPAAIGAVIYNEQGKVLVEISEYIGETTNNDAEYQALLAALKGAVKLRAKRVECFLDSELVTRQLNKEYKVKDKKLQKLFVSVWNLVTQIGSVKFYIIPREQNSRADKLVNKALDAKSKVNF